MEPREGEECRQDLPKPECVNAGEQFNHEQAGESQTKVVERLIGRLPELAIEARLAAMLTDMEGDEEVSKDARDVGSDKEDDEVVAPFAGQELLQSLPEVPNPRAFAVNLGYVPGDEVAALPEGREVPAI